MKKVLITGLFIVGMVISATSQNRKPAMAKKSTKKSEVQAQGYFKDKASNNQQDKELKRINDEEKQSYKPKPKANAPKPKSTGVKSKGKVIEQ